MANFHPQRPGEPWMRTSHDAPVDLYKRNAQASIVPMSQPRQLSRKESFRPLAHRTLPLMLFAAIVAAIIAALEYSVHVLPTVSFDLASQAGNITSQINITLNRRQEGASPTTTDQGAAATTFPTGVPPSSSFLDAAATTFPTGVPPSSSFLDAAATTIIAPGAPAPSSFLNAAATSIAVPRPSHTISDVYNAGDATTVVTPQTTPVVEGSPGASGANPGAHGGVTAGAGASAGAEVSVTLSSAEPPSLYMNPTAASGGGPVPTNINTGNENRPTLQSKVPLHLVNDPRNYFVGVYVPVLVAVVIRILAGYLYRCTKLVDPFVTLSETGGAPIHHFLWVDHLGSESVLAPWYALRARRWTLLFTAVLYGSTQLLTPFASELTSIQKSNYDYKTATSAGYVRGQALWVNSIVVRILQGLLGFVFIMIVSVGVLLHMHKSGVRGSPASIAAIASLMGHPRTARDFAQADQYADKKSTIEHFGQQSYRLESYIAPDGRECYGIVPIGTHPLSDDPTNAHHFTDEPSRSIGRKDGINLLLVTVAVLALLGIVVAYTINTAPTAFEHFMDSQSFGPRFLLTTLALVVKSPLLSLCARTVASVPFVRLAARPRSASRDLIAPLPVTPLGAIGYAVQRRAWFAASLGVAAGVVVEILFILLPGVPFEAQQYYDAARASWFGTIGCLGLILLVVLVGWIRLCVTRGAPWPKSPTTVGAIAMYVAGTSMATDAAEGEVLQGPRYDFARRDGRWVVEYADVPTVREPKPGGRAFGSDDPRESYGVVSLNDDPARVNVPSYGPTRDGNGRDLTHAPSGKGPAYAHNEVHPRDTDDQIASSGHFEPRETYAGYEEPAQNESYRGAGFRPGHPRYRSVPSGPWPAP